MYQNNQMYEEEQGRYSGAETLNTYVSKTFGWMFAGLAVTALVAWFGAASGFAANLLYGSGSMLPLILITVAELGVVFYLSSRIQHMAVGTARGLFFVYSALNGLVFSMYFLLFDMGVLAFAFVAAALYLGIMAAYGYLTKRDLTSWGRMLMFGLVGLLIASVLSLLFNFGASGILVSAVGIVLFLGLTAYDTQRIKEYYFSFAGDDEMAAKASIFGALNLYLDFINIFLYILRMLSRSRD